MIRQSLAGNFVEGVVGAAPPAAEKENIAFPECRALVVGDLFEGFDGDGLGFEMGWFEAFGVGPGGVVEKDTTAYNATTLSPCCISLVLNPSTVILK